MRAQVFSTANMAPQDRYEAWRCRDWPSLAPIMDTRRPAVFRAEVLTYDLGLGAMICADMTGLAYQRDARRIRSDHLDHFGIMVCRKGGFVGAAQGAAFAGGEGSVLIGDFGQPHVHASLDGQATALTLPRPVVESVIPRLSELHGVVLQPDEARMLYDFVCSLQSNAPHLDPSEGPRLVRVYLELLALTVRSRLAAETAPTSGDDALMWRARRLIEQNLEDPALGPDFISGRLGISLSALYRAFERHDGVAAYVRRRRLDRAAQMLKTMPPGRTIAQVAEAVGFPDDQTFRRQFRKVFNVSPADYVRNAAQD